jgi:hypothetical protein
VPIDSDHQRVTKIYHQTTTHVKIVDMIGAGEMFSLYSISLADIDMLKILGDACRIATKKCVEWLDFY